MLADSFFQDLRFGFRTLLRAPGFTLLAIITLALGIGANTAMFSVIDKVLLASLPYKDPAKVLYVAQRQPNGNTNAFSVSDFLEWKRQSSLLQRMSPFRPAGIALGASDQPERLTGASFSSDMFYVVGVSPIVGRAFTAAEDQPGAGRFLLIGETLWRTRFSGNPDISGTTIDMDGAPATILGVMPAGFYINDPAEQAWKPMQLQTQDVAASSRTIHSLFVLARLSPGLSVAQEQSQLDAVAARLHHEDPQGDPGFGVYLQKYQDAITSGIKPALLLLMGCVGFVLLIACSNVANLLLARAAGREMEISIRSALGARRTRLIRQLLTESLVLAVLGGLLGLAVAFAGLKALL